MTTNDCTYYLLCFAFLILTACKHKSNKSTDAVTETQEFQQHIQYKRLQVDAHSYFVCTANPDLVSINVHNLKPDTNSIYTMADLQEIYGTLLFAMNAGMYDEQGRAIGLLISNATQEHSLNARTDGHGNFYELGGNGIFLVSADTPAIITSKEYNSKKYHPDNATQSGPMLVTKGTINPKFSQQSSNLKIRNGIGVDTAGNVVCIISETPVSFYELATTFRDSFHCANALYLDGEVSHYYALGYQEKLQGRYRLGPILTITGKQMEQERLD